MRKAPIAAMLAVSVGLSACQTLDGIKVNGATLGVKKAQGSDSFCDRNLTLCIVGGVVVVGGIVAVAADSGGGGGGY